MQTHTTGSNKFQRGAVLMRADKGGWPDTENRSIRAHKNAQHAWKYITFVVNKCCRAVKMPSLTDYSLNAAFLRMVFMLQTNVVNLITAQS